MSKEEGEIEEREPQPQPPDDRVPPMTNDQWLKSQCNRYTNGTCSTLACFRRGGASIKPEFATCEAHEVLKELYELRSANLNHELRALKL